MKTKINDIRVEPNLDLNIAERKFEKKSLKSLPKHKKMGFFSAIMLVIGSSVGAGIFIKNWNILNNVQFALFYAILAWIIAIIGMLALVFALVEVCSGTGHANSQGVIGWVREYNSKFMYRASKNFMAYIHTPLIYVMMPFYMIMVSQQAFCYSMPWYGAFLITLAIGVYHIWFVGFFVKAANISNWIVSMIEFIPLFFACVSGFIIVGLGVKDPAWDYGDQWFHKEPTSEIKSFAHLTLMLGILNSIPAVFFSFDGFYNTAGIQSELKEPEKMPKVLVIGVSIVSAFEILVSTSLLIGCKDGSLFGLSFKDSIYPRLLIQILMVCVLTGMLSVVAGNAIYAPRFYESLIAHDELPFCKKYKNRLNSHKPVVGTVVIQILFLIILCIITFCGLVFWDVGGYGLMKGIDERTLIYGSGYSSHMAGTLSFLDTVANWNALFAFMFVTIAIFGCLRNRKTKKVKTIKSKTFVPSAIIAILVVGTGVLFVFINAFGDFGYQIYQFIEQKNTSTDLIGAGMTLVMLVIFSVIMIVPAYLEKHKAIKKI